MEVWSGLGITTTGYIKHKNKKSFLTLVVFCEFVRL